MFRLSREIREVVVTGGNLSNPRAVALTLVEYGNLLFWAIPPVFLQSPCNSYPGIGASQKLPDNFRAMPRQHLQSVSQVLQSDNSPLLILIFLRWCIAGL